MTANELLIARECDVTFDGSSAHARRGFVGLPRMLGKLQRGAAMADGEFGFLHRLMTALPQCFLEIARIHLLDKEVRSRSEIDTDLLRRYVFGD